MNWRVDGIQMRHPKYGTFMIRVFEDGTALACRVYANKKDSTVEQIIPSSLLGKTVEEAKEACESRIRQLELLEQLENLT